jgi:nitroreductase/ferredoxin
MIVLDREKCQGCGLCARICHEHCITLVDENHHATPSIDLQFCSTCTQCIAACPRQALSWDGVAPVAADRGRLPSPEQLDELFKQRRTIRFFKPDPIHRALLQEIVGYGIYAPTNNYALRAIVLDDQEIIDRLDRESLSYAERIYNLFYRPGLVFSLLSRLWPKQDYLQAKPKLESALERGSNLPAPAAIVFIVGDGRTPLSIDSAQYVLYNMILYAQLKGIGACLYGPGRLFLDRNRVARTLLGLHKHEHIFGTVLLGYPDVRFANKVQGKALPIQWNAAPPLG